MHGFALASAAESPEEMSELDLSVLQDIIAVGELREGKPSQPILVDFYNFSAPAILHIANAFALLKTSRDNLNLQFWNSRFKGSV